MTDPSVGPALPPNSAPQHHSSGSEEEDCYMPALPPHLVKACGKEEVDVPSGGDASSEDEEGMYGPALPPHLLKNHNTSKSPPSQRRPIVGPTLPKGFVPPPELPGRGSVADSEGSDTEEEEQVIGPVLPSQPLDMEQYRIQQLELRAQRMKDKLQGKDLGDKPLARESWMTELPEDKPNFCGLGARQFLRKTPMEKGDRSVWTDTPTDKARKEKVAAEALKEETPEDVAQKRKNEELSVKVEEYNRSKRPKSLVDLHQKKLKKKGSSSGGTERKPFSREEDLQVNKFDEAQKKTILKKAQQLNDRFSGGSSKFL